MKRLLAALLCAVMVLALLPVSAYAYSTTSNRGTELQYPGDGDYFACPFEAKVKTFDGGEGIYLMPMPEKGHGHLGSVLSGKTVLILAEKNGYFFFETGRGYLGWNGSSWFDYKDEDVPGKCGGSSEPADYPVFSSKGVRLSFPREDRYLDEAMTMTVKASHSTGSIYLMPMPEKGHGNLGTVLNGTEVTILAEQNGYYFFQTADGRCGWNGSRWFE